MKIDLLGLINGRETELNIDEVIEIPHEYYEKTDIRHLDPINVKGIIYPIGEDVFNLNLDVNGKMVLPCALTLEDVDYPFTVNIDQNIGNDEDFEKNYKIVSNTLDILPILWENIVLEIPSRVVKDDAHIKTEGDGWCLTSEEDYESSKDNKLSDLKELLEMEE